MTRRHFAGALCIAAVLAIVLSVAQGSPNAQGGGQVGNPPAGGTAVGAPQGAGRRGAAPGGALVGGTLTPKKADERGWGWQVKAMMNPATPRPLYNRAKEALFNDRQITSFTISTFDPDLYCEVGKHFDYIWFEMQHSTMSWDEIRRMIAACPKVGAAPMVRMPDAFESSIQKATDIGALGIIVPTVDDALEARDAARYSRYPPYGRRSLGSGQYNQIWSGLNYRETINDNMLVTVMIETLEGVAMAEEIAATHGVDVIILGNNDLSSFSGWQQSDPRYQDAIIKVHDAALKYGKYYGNAGSQFLNGYTVSADTRMVQNGPACDGWTPPGRGGRGRGASPDEEPTAGIAAGAATATTAAAKSAANCWK
jgi:2-keto-3-deoxy-L-rhamnonate aldolase RhmA